MSGRHCATVSIVVFLCYTCAASAQQPEETVLRVTTRLVQVSLVAQVELPHTLAMASPPQVKPAVAQVLPQSI